MFRKLAVSIIAAIAMMIMSAQTVTAGSGDAIVGGIVGGVIVNQVNKNKSTQTTSSTSSGSAYYTSQRQQNSQVQTALNYYNFPAGAPDGVIGRRTRTAVSSYQVFMGYPATGYLTEFQKSVLLNSYYRSIAGGVEAAQVVANSPYGARGMLKQTQLEMAGGTANYAAVQPTEDDSTFKLPSFGEAPDTNSLANHCNKISLITNTNGGYTNVSTMQDPVFVLNEQFCLARIYAISTSEEMISKVQGSSSAQIQTQCETLGPALREQVAALSLESRDRVIAKTTDMILSAGMSPAQMTHTAKICLGIGYRTDDSEVALASTLILVALGEPVYGELLGHHLLNGFGTAQRKDLSLQWYASATDAIDQGMPAVFVPGQTDRPALIQAAVGRLNETAAAAEQSQATGFVVPTFGAETTTGTTQ